MTTAQNDENRIRQYLLGALPAAETEAFDELSFHDDEFAQRLQVVEDDLVDAYVHGELAEAELARFQSYYLASPRRLAKVKFAQSLQGFAAQQFQMPALAAVSVAELSREPPAETASRQPAREETSWWRSLLNRLAVPRFAWQTGLAAAAVLLCALSSWLLWETLRLRGELKEFRGERAALEQRAQELQQQLERQRDRSTQEAARLRDELQQTQTQLAQLERERTLALRQPEIFAAELAPQRRSGASQTTLALPVSTDYVSLRLGLGSEDYPAYRVELRTRAGNQLVWSSSKLTAHAKGDERVIRLSLRATLLPPREYVLFLKGITAAGSSEEVRSYSFNVVRP